MKNVFCCECERQWYIPERISISPLEWAPIGSLFPYLIQKNSCLLPKALSDGFTKLEGLFKTPRDERESCRSCGSISSWNTPRADINIGDFEISAKGDDIMAYPSKFRDVVRDLAKSQHPQAACGQEVLDKIDTLVQKQLDWQKEKQLELRRQTVAIKSLWGLKK